MKTQRLLVVLTAANSMLLAFLLTDGGEPKLRLVNKDNKMLAITP